MIAFILRHRLRDLIRKDMKEMLLSVRFDSSIFEQFYEKKSAGISFVVISDTVQILASDPCVEIRVLRNIRIPAEISGCPT